MKEENLNSQKENIELKKIKVKELKKELDNEFEKTQIFFNEIDKNEPMSENLKLILTETLKDQNYPQNIIRDFEKLNSELYENCKKLNELEVY